MSQENQGHNKIISIMTNCAICSKLITKKNFEDGIYICDDCKELHDLDKAIKIYESSHNDDDLTEELDKIIEKIYNLHKLDE
jgi:acetyl-CoA carboxylase beta subunit